MGLRHPAFLSLATVALAAMLAGCIVIQPPIDPSPTPTSDASADADREACRMLSKAMKTHTQDTLDDPSAEGFAASYKLLAFAIGDAALKAAPGSVVQTSLEKMAATAAASSDALRTNNGLSTEEQLAVRTTITAAHDACHFTITWRDDQ